MLGRCGVVVTVGLGLAACVSIPPDVKQTFEPPRSGETSYFERRPDAPRPEGFVPPPSPSPSPTSSSTPTLAPSSTPAP